MGSLSILRFARCDRRYEIIHYGTVLFAGVFLFSGLTASAYAAPRSGRPLAAARVPATQGEKDTRKLEPGKQMGRELTAGQAHSYRIELTSGQCLHIIVDQRGVDVVLTALSPDGTTLVEVDSPNGNYGPEHLWLVAESSGIYQLEVRSLAKNAQAGRYEIGTGELRSATPRDSSLLVAQKLFAEAGRLLTRDTPEFLRASIEKYLAALSQWRAAGERGMEALTLKTIGRACDGLGERQKALDYYSQTLLLTREIGDRREEAITLNDLGLGHGFLGNKREAIEYYNQALAIWRDLNDRQEEAHTLNNVGRIYSDWDEKQTALNYYNQSLLIKREFGDRSGEAVTLNNIGFIYSSLGEKRTALDYYYKALAIRKEVGGRAGEATLLNNIGAAHNAIGDKQSALRYYNQALQLWQGLGNREGEATTLSNIGKVYDNLGDKQNALDYYDKALKISHFISDRLGEAQTDNNIAGVYLSLNQYEKALEYANGGLALSKALSYHTGEAVALYRIAQLAHRRGNLIEAHAKIASALQLIESLRTKIDIRQLRSSYLASVQKYYSLDIDLLMQLHTLDSSKEHNAAAFHVSERSRARSLLELLNEARADIRQGIDSALLERERSLRQLLNLRVERQTRLLSSKHTEEQAATAKNQIEDTLTQYQEIEGQIRAASPRYAAITQPQPLTLSEIQQQVLDSDTLLLEYALGDERSYVWAVSQSSIASFELPKRADIEAAALRVYELLIAANRRKDGETTEQRRARLTQAEAQYPEAAAALSRMVLSPVASFLKAKRLLIVCEGALQYIPFAALPAPVVSTLTSLADENDSVRSKNRRSMADYKPMVLEHEIVSLPSASALAVLRREIAGRKPAAKAVAVLADPVFDKDDERLTRGTKIKKIKTASAPIANSSQQVTDVEGAVREVGSMVDRGRLSRLPFSRREAQAILAIVPRGEGTLALDFKASRATATNAGLAQYRTVHFATHGLLDSEHPELSGIVLSLVDEHGTPQDGFLRLHDIYNLSLPAELVVLSACQTALGKDMKGEGLVGLTRGFMYAGAARVVASLWQVNDAATAELMGHFYRGMMRGGLRPAAALQAAQVEMWKQARWKSPYYWAAFVLQGEWK